MICKTLYRVIIAIDLPSFCVVVVMNPVDHPHGGGEGKTSGGRHPVSPWGLPTKGKKTRKATDFQNAFDALLTKVQSLDYNQSECDLDDTTLDARDNW